MQHPTFYEMAESLEYKTLVRCRSKLVTALQLDPPDVADVLISKGLIRSWRGAQKNQGGSWSAFLTKWSYLRTATTALSTRSPSVVG